MKKSFLFLTALLTMMVGWVSPAWGASESDLVTISKNYTYYFDQEMTATYSSGTLFGDSHFLSVGGNTYSNGKGKTDEHLNCCRVKGFNLAVKIAPNATIVATGNADSRRQYVVALSKSPASVSDLMATGEEGGASVEYTNNTEADQVIYIGGVGNGTVSGGDLYLGKIQVTIATSGTEPSVSFSSSKYTAFLGKDFESPKAELANCGENAAVYSSDNTAVATVDASTGDVTLVAAGVANITATVNVDGTDYSEFYELTVRDVASVSFAKNIEGVYNVNRMFPSAATVDKGDAYTLPVNYIYYKEGSTVSSWSAGALGGSFTVSEDTEITPVFTENTKSLANNAEAATVVFDFKRGTNGGRFVNIEKNADVFITTAVVDGETIDVALPVDANTDAGIEGKNGKLNNTSNLDNAQCNTGTVFTFENIRKGATIVFTATVNIAESENITFNGEEIGVVDGKTLTFTATEDGDVKAVVLQNNFWMDNIKVTYPAVEAAPAVVYPFVPEGGTVENVVLDFTTNDWGLPETYVTTAETYSNGTYRISFGESSNGHKFNSTYLIFGKSGATMSLPAFDFDVEKIEIVGNSGASGKVTQNIFVGENAVSTETTGATGTYVYEIAPEYQAAGNIYTIKVTNANNTQITKITVYPKSSEAAPVAAPTFSVAAGTYNEVQTVALTAEEGAAIYYTTDAEATLSSESTLYTEPIAVNETTTIRAFAVKDGQGSVEVNATYTIVLPTEVATVAELNKLAKDEVFKFTGEAIVAANPTAKNLYLMDETGSTLVYNGAGGLEFEVGAKIAANWTGKVTIYNGLFEAVPTSELTAVEGETVEVEIETVDASAFIAENMNKIVAIDGVTYTAPNGKNFTITVGETEIAGYNQFGIEIAEPDDMAIYNMVGAISVYNDQVQFQPIAIEMDANFAAALADIAWWEGLCEELTAAMKDNEEYILPDTRSAIESFMSPEYYPSAIQAALEDANEGYSDYVCPFDKELIESQVRGWIAEIEGIKNGTIALYTETGVVGDYTLNSEMPYFATPVTTEVYVDKVVLKGWDGTEGSDLTIGYTKIAQNEEVTLSITGIEQTVNGEVVSELNDEGETPYVMLQPQSGAYSMIGIDVLNEDGMTGIKLGEGGGQIFLYGQFFPIPNIGGEDDNMGVEESIEAIYAVTWPGQEIINAVAWNRIKAQIANVEEAIANYDAIVSTMNYASRVEGEEFNAAVDAAREWVSTTTETYKAKYEAGTLTAEDGVKGDMMEQTMAVNDALNQAAMYDINRYVQSAVYYWMGDEDEIKGQKEYVESVIETMSGPGKTALEEQVALLDAALQSLLEDWAAYTLYSPEKHQELIDRAEGIKLSITDIVEQAEEAVGINKATVNATSTAAPVYNLAGQKVSSNYNGIVVKNGKKVIVK